jgi:hypothetical protein
MSRDLVETLLQGGWLTGQLFLDWSVCFFDYLFDQIYFCELSTTNCDFRIVVNQRLLLGPSFSVVYVLT